MKLRYLSAFILAAATAALTASAEMLPANDTLPASTFRKSVFTVASPAKAGMFAESNPGPGIRAEIDAGTGRLVFLGTSKGPNLLWTDPLARRRVGNVKYWANWGGEKTWLWPQSAWSAHGIRSWPPLKECERFVERIDIPNAMPLSNMDCYNGGMMFVTPRIPGFDGVIEKSFVIRETVIGRSSLVVNTKYTGKAAAPWSITQVTVERATPYVRIVKGGEANCSLGGKTFPEPKRVGKNVYRIVRSGECDEKSGYDADVIAVRIGDELLTIHDITFKHTGIPHKPGERAQIYARRDASKYAGYNPHDLIPSYYELEFIAPYDVSDPEARVESILTLEYRIFQLAPEATDSDIAKIIQQL